MDFESVYFSGVWHGALGVGLIVAGLIGWPKLRFLLRLVFGPKSGVSRHKIYRAGPAAPAPFWEQYK